MQQAQTTQLQAPPKLSEKIYFVYFFQEFALGMITVLGVQFIAFFMTNVAFYGVVGGAAIAATILTIGRFFDIFTVPVVGIIVERANLRWGKYRSWLYIFAPLTGLFALLQYSDLGLAPIPTAIYMTVAYLLMFTAVNFCSTARMSLLPVLTKDPAERAKLSVRRGQGVAVGNIFRGFVTLPLVVFLGGGAAAHLGGRNSQGFVLTALVYGAITVIGLYWLASVSKPYDPSRAKGEAPKSTGGKQATVGEMIRVVATNKPLLIFIVANLLTLTSTNILTGFNMFYFNYVVGNLAIFAIYLPLTFAGNFVGMTIAKPMLSKFKSVKKVYVIGMALYAAFMALAFLSPAANPIPFTILVVVAMIGNGIGIGLVPMVFSDTADYGELKAGKSVRAAIMALVIFPIKLGVFIGGTIASWGLVGIGFVAGVQDPVVAQGIRVWITLPNAGFAVLAGLVMLAYPLTHEKVLDIQRQLKERAQAQQG